MRTTAVVIFAHGSSVESANEAVRRVAANVAREGRCGMVEAAFLEQGQPDLSTAVHQAIAKGAVRVVVVPYFLTPGIHLERDLPRLVEDLLRKHPGVEIRVTPPLDGHPALGEILNERVEEALGRESS